MNYKLTYLVLLCIFSHVAKAQVFQEEINTKRTFAINTNSTVEINNKYGNIHISTWDKDSVEFNVNFFISEKSETKFNKAKDNVDFKFLGNSHYISAETVFGSKYGTLFKDLQEATNLSTGATGSQINFYVTLPKHINLKIKNRYGNLFISDYNGSLDIFLSNGDFQGRNLKGNTNLSFAFGDVNINEVKQGTLKLNFSDVNIQSLDNVNLESKSSKINIKKASLIKLNSRRDELTIDEIDNIFGSTYFSKVSILNLTKEFNLQMKYGELTHLQLASGFELAKLTSEFSNATILLKAPKAYMSSIFNEKGEIELPPALKPENPNWRENIEPKVENFIHKEKQARIKLQIKIKDAFLKIIHN